MSNVSVASVIPSPAVQSDVTALLERPLILGASVSADYNQVPSPGKKLALLYTSEKNIRVDAMNGRTGYETLKKIGEVTLADRSILIGVDLFFWDARVPVPQKSVASLKKLIALAKAQNLPVILGDIPGLIPLAQPGRETLNRELAEACAEWEKCRVLPLHQMLGKILREQSLVHRGQRYTLPELVPDGLHLSHVGSEYLADRILELIENLP